MKKQISRKRCKYYSFFMLRKDIVAANVLTRALFSRALAELRYFAMIKNSKKKADHIAKISWKGL